MKSLIKKIILLAALFLAASAAYSQQWDNQRQQLEEQRRRSDYDEGIVINGVRWATRNVDEAGTFAPTPESAGKYYQWNNKKAWASTGAGTGWRNTIDLGVIWEKTNDPCPQDWRVPTDAELKSLVSSGHVLTTKNGVLGRLFGTSPNAVFLPGAGYLYGPGKSSSLGNGYYWSNKGYYFQAFSLNFDHEIARVYRIGNSTGACVRFVSEKNENN